MDRGHRIAYRGAFLHCINWGNHNESIYPADEDYHFKFYSMGEGNTQFGAIHSEG